MDEAVDSESNSYYNYVLGELAEKEQDFSAATSYYQKASIDVSDSNSQIILKTKLAELYVKEGKNDLAQVECEKILELDPKNVGILFLYARILETKKDNASARKVYKTINQVKPDKIEAYVLRSNLLLKDQQLDAAEVALSEYLNHNDENALIYFYLGKLKYVSRDFKKAEQYYLKSLDMDSSEVNSTRALLELYLGQERSEDAENIARLAIKENPNNTLARRVLGEILVVSGRYDEALEHLQVLESYQSSPNETRIKIALIQIEKQDFKKAEKELKFVLSNDPKNSLAKYYLGMSYVGQDRLSDATKELLSIDKTDTYYVKARTFAYFLYKQVNDVSSASRCIGEAYLNNPGNEKLFSYYASTLREQDKLEEGLKVTKDAILVNSRSLTFLYTEGVFLSDLNRESEAVESMEKVLAVDPKNAEALNFIAYSLAEREIQLARAEKLILGALAIKPDDFYYRDTYAWILLKLGRLEEARVELSQVVNSGANDTVILEHYADVLAGLGQKVEARKVNGRILENLSSRVITKKELEQIKRIKTKMAN